MNLTPFKEKRLWQWFVKHLKEFEDTNAGNPVFGAFHNKLAAIHSALVFEISPKDENGISTLVISCDGIRGAIPAVEQLVAKAPVVDGWDVIAFRQPVRESLTIEIGSIKLSTDDIKFEYQATPNQMIDVTLYVEGVNDNNRDDYLRAVFILLDAAIGELMAMTKIRRLDLVPVATGKLIHPLSKLIDIIGQAD